MRSTTQALFCIGLALALACTGCTSTIVEKDAPKAVTPQYFDFTQQREGEDQGPVDQAKCKHVWMPYYTHPYQYLVNGLPVTRLCGVIRCERCGLVRHECNNPEARP